MPSTNAAGAAVLLMALAGPVSAQPAPQPLTILDVPYLSQSEALCGGAAAAMVLRYWGERGLTAESFAHLVDRSAAGIRTTALVDELRARGWNAVGIAGTADRIERELDQGRPVLALIDDRPGTFHYIVIVAATPRAVVFHDPARAPMRVVSRDEFERRWTAADRWMAVIVPGEPPVGADLRVRPEQTGQVRAGRVAASTSCDRLVEEGVARAQANDLDAAERSLAAALSCPGPAAMRELAGVRLLQRRWADVDALASTAVAIDPDDAHAWRLLGTSRFVQDDRRGALDAWNRVAEPRLDVIRVDGLTRTRHQAVERLIGESVGGVLTPERVVRAGRRLDDLPSATATRLEYVPVPSGLAELRAVVTERPLAPPDVWGYASIGLRAVARRELDYAAGSLTGGGEQLSGAWRFWPRRPRLQVSVAAPAPWGGTWDVRAFAERQAFDREDLETSERTAVDLRVANWITSTLHVAASAGLHEWRDAGTFGAAGTALRFRSRDDRIDARIAVDTWLGDGSFAALDMMTTARSTAERRGRVYLARVGAGLTSRSTPPDAWFGGDTGDTRAALLRAHPLVDEGRLRAGRLGRRLLYGSGEAQQWWPVSIARIGAALFVDTLALDGRLEPGLGRDADVGAGLRLALPGAPGTFRLDVARGLRDGATGWSFVYEP